MICAKWHLLLFEMGSSVSSLQKKSPTEHFCRAKETLAATYSPILLRIVPSAKRCLTSEFGMGSGVTTSPLPPEKIVLRKIFP